MGQVTLNADVSDLQKDHILHLKGKGSRQNSDLPGMLSVSLITSNVLTNIWEHPGQLKSRGSWR